MYIFSELYFNFVIYVYFLYYVIFFVYMLLSSVFLLCQARTNMKDFLATIDDPQTALLDLLESCNISKGKGNALANIIANETQKWLLEHPECQLVRTKCQPVQFLVLIELYVCSYSLMVLYALFSSQSGLRLKKVQARVFHLATEGQLLDYLISIYRLQEADRSFLLGPVTHLHLMGKYKEVRVQKMPYWACVF